MQEPSQMNTPHIILVGLCSESNLGDVALMDASCRILQESLAETRPGWEVVRYDLWGEGTVNNSLAAGLWRRLKRLVRLGWRKEDSYAMALEELFMRKVEPATRAIIFAGGGIIKYKYQKFPWMVAPIVHCAKRHGIPVMFSGVGVEDYCDKDWRCRYLKRAINSPCVKSISTRDDLESLRRYVSSSRIRVTRVADPACSLGRMIPCAPKAQPPVVGVGICRDKLFEDNGVQVSGEEMKELYAALYREFARRGICCRFFTNGDKADVQFAARVAAHVEKAEKTAGLLMPRPLTSEDLVRQISSFSGVVATRLHASIISYAYDVPFVGLVWNRKQILFGEAVGRAHCFLQAGDFSARTICDRLAAAMAQPQEPALKQAYMDTTRQEMARFLAEHVST